MSVADLMHSMQKLTLATTMTLTTGERGHGLIGLHKVPEFAGLVI